MSLFYNLAKMSNPIEKERVAKRVADERRKQEEVRADEMRACQEKLDSMKKNELSAKLFEGKFRHL